METITHDSIKSFLQSQIDKATSFAGGDLAKQRKQALDYYLGRPFGNEVDGRSKVVSTDVADTIEWILPSLLDIFTASGDVVRFEPVGMEDKRIARQASDYINYIFNKDNNGFLILYTWFKDALLQKNGFIKYWWQNDYLKQRQRVDALDDQALIALLADVEMNPNMKILSIDSTPTEDGGSYHSALIETSVPQSKIQIQNVPPEEFLIEPNAKSIKEARFVAHRTYKSVSDMIKMGYAPEIFDNVASDDSQNLTPESLSRSLISDQNFLNNDSDDATRMIMVYECYARLDMDGDGVAELRKITAVGKNLLILDNQEIDEIPFCSLTPIIIPHQFYGLSMADIVMDLQLLKSTILRQLIDNMYLTNNSRQAVVDGQVNLDDLLTTRPGGIVRVKSPGAINPIVTPTLSSDSYGLLDYIDGIRESRTGVTKYNQGLDADSLNKTAAGIQKIMTASQQRIELIARIFAETGVKDLFKSLLKLVCRYQEKSRQVCLSGQWLSMQPDTWNPDMDVTVTVGLGTGNRDLVFGHLATILSVQKDAIALQGGLDGPLVGHDNINNTLRQMAINAGLSSPEQYFIPPEKAAMIINMQAAQSAANPPQPSLDQVYVENKMGLDSAKFRLDAYKTVEDLRLKGVRV